MVTAQSQVWRERDPPSSLNHFLTLWYPPDMENKWSSRQTARSLEGPGTQQVLLPHFFGCCEMLILKMGDGRRGFWGGDGQNGPGIWVSDFVLLLQHFVSTFLTWHFHVWFPHSRFLSPYLFLAKWLHTVWDTTQVPMGCLSVEEYPGILEWTQEEKQAGKVP